MRRDYYSVMSSSLAIQLDPVPQFSRRPQSSLRQYSPRMHELNCSRHAVFFLCSFYAPICLPGIDESEENIKPCRSFCEQVRRDCAGSLGYWPRFAKCEELPNFSDGVCVQPESFEVVQRPTGKLLFRSFWMLSPI